MCSTWTTNELTTSTIARFTVIITFTLLSSIEHSAIELTCAKLEGHYHMSCSDRGHEVPRIH
jgi:hypothetical protein